MDKLRTEALRADALLMDALRMDALRSDALLTDALRTDALLADVLLADALLADALWMDGLRTGALWTDALRMVGRPGRTGRGPGRMLPRAWKRRHRSCISYVPRPTNLSAPLGQSAAPGSCTFIPMPRLVAAQFSSGSPRYPSPPRGRCSRPFLPGPRSRTLSCLSLHPPRLSEFLPHLPLSSALPFPCLPTMQVPIPCYPTTSLTLAPAPLVPY